MGRASGRACRGFFHAQLSHKQFAAAPLVCCHLSFFSGILRTSVHSDHGRKILYDDPPLLQPNPRVRQRLEIALRKPGTLYPEARFRLVKSYYQHATDKRRALREILQMTDPNALLTHSGWHPGIRLQSS
jgi:hypothetical protein